VLELWQLLKQNNTLNDLTETHNGRINVIFLHPTESIQPNTFETQNLVFMSLYANIIIKRNQFILLNKQANQ